ncbi:MAG: DUF389 domain-containing protein [Anaerolineales bacterium]
MNLTPPDTLPDDDPQLPAARRRHAERSLFGPLSVDERSQALEQVVSRAASNVDFFLYALFSGAVLGLGFLFDSPYLLILGALIAPLMAPAVGAALGVSLGSPRHFGRSLVGLLLAGAMVFAAGWLAGLAASASPRALTLVYLHAQFYWVALITLAIAGVLTTGTLIREQNAEVPSLALSYGLFTPLAAAAFGLGSGLPHLWPAGLVIFGIHLATAVFSAAATLVAAGFRPPTVFGYSIGAAVLMIGLLAFIGFTGAGAVFGAHLGLATLTPSRTPTATWTATPSLTPTPSRTGTTTPTQQPTPTQTLTPTPSPIVAIIDVEDGSGAFVREEPAGQAFTTVLNGTIVHILPEPAREAGGQLWLHVYIPALDRDGWLLQNLVATATPSPTP